MSQIYDFELHLVHLKIFINYTILSTKNIFWKINYSRVFSCIPENALENVFSINFPHFFSSQTNT